MARLTPIVYLPGFAASELLDTRADRQLFYRFRGLDETKRKKEVLPRLQGPNAPGEDDGVVPTDPIGDLFDLPEPFVDIAPGQLASSFYEAVGREGYRIGDGFLRPTGWDWRRPVDDRLTMDVVERAIAEAHEAGGEPVAIVAHGAGGLVVRALLEARPEVAARIRDVVFVFVPWAGCLDPIPFLRGERHFKPLSGAETIALWSRSWSLFDLLPTAPVEDDEGALDLFLADEEPASAIEKSGWLTKRDKHVKARLDHTQTRFGQRRRSIDLGPDGPRVWNLVGWGYDTLVRAVLDKKEIELETGDDGDGVVPRRSAAWLDGPTVRHLYVPIGNFQPAVHAHPWRSPVVREVLQEVAQGGDMPLSILDAAVDHRASERDQWIRIRLVAQDETGRVLEDAEACPADRDEPKRFEENGRLVLAIHRSRWRRVRDDLRQMRVHLAWTEKGRRIKKVVTCLTDVGEKK